MRDFTIKSFAASASLIDGDLAAFLVKFCADDNTELLTAWNRTQLPIFIRLCFEYHKDLMENQITFDRYAIAKTLSASAPNFSNTEISSLPSSAFVEHASAFMGDNQSLIFQFQRATMPGTDNWKLLPEQCESLIDVSGRVIELFNNEWIRDSSAPIHLH